MRIETLTLTYRNSLDGKIELMKKINNSITESSLGALVSFSNGFGTRSSHVKTIKKKKRRIVKKMKKKQE